MKSILHVKFTQSSAMFAAKNVTKKVDKNMSKKEKKNRWSIQNVWKNFVLDYRVYHTEMDETKWL